MKLNAVLTGDTSVLIQDGWVKGDRIWREISDISCLVEPSGAFLHRHTPFCLIPILFCFDLILLLVFCLLPFHLTLQQSKCNFSFYKLISFSKSFPR